MTWRRPPVHWPFACTLLLLLAGDPAARAGELEPSHLFSKPFTVVTNSGDSQGFKCAGLGAAEATLEFRAGGLESAANGSSPQHFNGARLLLNGRPCDAARGVQFEIVHTATADAGDTMFGGLLASALPADSGLDALLAVGMEDPSPPSCATISRGPVDLLRFLVLVPRKAATLSQTAEASRGGAELVPVTPTSRYVALELGAGSLAPAKAVSCLFAEPLGAGSGDAESTASGEGGSPPGGAGLGIGLGVTGVILGLAVIGAGGWLWRKMRTGLTRSGSTPDTPGPGTMVDSFEGVGVGDAAETSWHGRVVN
jgi:hypothetical protein